MVTDLINQLEIADGPKQLLLSKDFTLKSLLHTPVPDLAEILGIDEYIAKIIIRAIKEAVATKDPQNLIIHQRDQYLDPVLKSCLAG